jgi:hypothetical protein
VEKYCVLFVYFQDFSKRAFSIISLCYCVLEQNLKSCAPQGACRFDSGREHQSDLKYTHNTYEIIREFGASFSTFLIHVRLSLDSI